jgi:hypothetical protein
MIYYRFIYRPLMRLAHRYNWHHTKTIHPGGDTMLVCDWCGLRYLKAIRGRVGDVIHRPKLELPSNGEPSQ